ncbi:MAG: hypothetical protein V4760_10915 [Bdellovibrionota bacterium]
MIQRRHSIRTSILAFVAITAVLTGCGRGDIVYTDGGAELTKQDDSLPITIDDRSILPRGFFDQSVNRADVQIHRSTSNYPYLRLRLLGGTNTAGGFNGPGTGNRALVGLAQYDATLLTNIPTVTIDMKSDGLVPDVLLLVDLDCTGNVPRVLKADGNSLYATALALEGGFKRLEASTSAAVWTTNLDITDPLDPSMTLLSTSTKASLDDVITAYPNACIRNAASFDLAMPKSLPTAGVLLSLGGASTTAVTTVLIDRIEIGTDVYNDWEQQ